MMLVWPGWLLKGPGADAHDMMLIWPRWLLKGAGADAHDAAAERAGG